MNAMLLLKKICLNNTIEIFINWDSKVSVFFPDSSCLSSLDGTNLRREPSIELTPRDGQSSRIACLVK